MSMMYVTYLRLQDFCTWLRLGSLCHDSGSKRFSRLRQAVIDGRTVPPCDMRYLQKGQQRLDSHGDNARARIFTFLESVYHSQAETLPDVRDDPADEIAHVIAKVTFEDDYAAALQSKVTFEDDYAAALGSNVAVPPKQKKTRKHCRSIELNPDRVHLEERFLPPGTFRELYDQMCSADGESNKVSFVQFWRVFRKDFPHLKFRQHSTHSTCSVCTRHKLLIREMSHHLAARRKQHDLYIAHLQHQYQDRCLYWQLRSLSRSRCGEICIIIDSMDQAKFCYPRGGVYRTKELASLQRPRAHITGILMHGHGVMFSVSAQDMPKDSNSMIELMSHALTTLQKEHNIQLNQCVLNIQSDNTCREMKNNPFLRWLGYLVSNRALATSMIAWMISHDGCFPESPWFVCLVSLFGWLVGSLLLVGWLVVVVVAFVVVFDRFK